MSDYINTLVTERQKAWHDAKEILDRCAQDKRERTAEEDEMFTRANADIDRLGTLIDEHRKSAQIEKENAEAREVMGALGIDPKVDATRGVRELSVLEQMLRGQIGLRYVDVDLAPAAQFRNAIRNGMDATEARALYTNVDSSGSLVPTSFAQQLYAFMEASNAIRQISYVMTTSSGERMEFPRVNAHSIGTQVIAQGTVIGGTDPTFAKMALDSFKFGQLVRLSQEATVDTAIDLLGFVAQNIGRGIGRITDTAYVTGNGTTGPNGIVTAAGTGARTGGSLIPASYESLIDLQHSIIPEYRANGVFVMNDTTAGSLRKIRDGAGGTLGAFLWEPSLSNGVQNGQPDRLLGRPVYTDSNFAAQGSASRSVAFGDFSAYYIRDVAGLRVERSDERYFDSDEVAFRGVLRTDSDLIDSQAIRTLVQLP